MTVAAGSRRLDGALATGGGGDPSGLSAGTLVLIVGLLAAAAFFVVLDNRGWGWWPWNGDIGPNEVGKR